MDYCNATFFCNGCESPEICHLHFCLLEYCREPEVQEAKSEIREMKLSEKVVRNRKEVNQLIEQVVNF